MEKIKVADLPEFDAAKYLTDPESIAGYLNEIISANDPRLLAVALGDIAKAQGMTSIAKQTGIAREALYKALGPKAEPRFETISKVSQAFGVKITFAPMGVPKKTIGIRAKRRTKTRSKAEKKAAITVGAKMETA